MRKELILIACLSFLVVSVSISGCIGLKPTEKNFQYPVVELDYVEVAHYWGWWYYSSKVNPSIGKAGNYGAPLDLAFTFNITNPNKYPIHLEELKFTIAFEEFDLNTVTSTASQWIPAGMTNQLRVHAMFDGRQSLLSLLVTGGFKLKEKRGKSGIAEAFKQLGIWWEGIPDYSFPIYVKEGAAIFNADKITKVKSFTAQFP